MQPPCSTLPSARTGRAALRAREALRARAALPPRSLPPLGTETPPPRRAPCRARKAGTERRCRRVPPLLPPGGRSRLCSPAVPCGSGAREDRIAAAKKTVYFKKANYKNPQARLFFLGGGLNSEGSGEGQAPCPALFSQDQCWGWEGPPKSSRPIPAGREVSFPREGSYEIEEVKR